MPCFKGLAISVHTPDGPLAEYATSKQAKHSRISSYIAVPPPRTSKTVDGLPEQSTFAISITLLAPGQDVPYSTPKATPDNPHPQPRKVGALPGHTGDRKIGGTVHPYVPLTTSPNETIAAYIYFDGRPKEEVATLLRKSEETWVNSRWCSLPASEGGGLVEREFIFREVGLENWLNGLDLEGKDAAAIIEKRRQKLEKRRRKRKNVVPDASDDEDFSTGKDSRKVKSEGHGIDVSDDDDPLSDSITSDDDDDDPIPEAAGQIKVALFRVLASGEIKRGEYSPQFDAHDDEGDANGHNGKDVDHTTSFAKPKTLDPKTISTQTVTGIDASDRPFMTATFLYRGKRQLEKMGILPKPEAEKTPTSVKRRSGIPELASLKPLKKTGTTGFSGYRDTDPTPKAKSKTRNVDDMTDSDEEDDDIQLDQKDVLDDKTAKTDPTSTHLSPEEAERADAAAAGIRKMKLKRQHSAEPLNRDGTPDARKSNKSGSNSPHTLTNAEDISATPTQNKGLDIFGARTNGNTQNGEHANEVKKEDEFQVGSPFKRARSSMAEFGQDVKDRLAGRDPNTSNSLNEIMGSGIPVPSAGLNFGGALFKKADDNDEEL